MSGMTLRTRVGVDILPGVEAKLAGLLLEILSDRFEIVVEVNRLLSLRAFHNLIFHGHLPLIQIMNIF